MTAHVLPRGHKPRIFGNMVGGAQAQGSEALTSETRVAGALTWKAQGSAKLMFSDAALYGLLIPIIVEQFLNALMGMADTMMISNLGSAAISAVSLTDSINTLMIQVFAALAAGGTVICSQYLGQKNLAQCNKAARQLLLIILVLSGGIAAFCFALRRPLLALIFGQVSGDVMAASLVYFEITVLSYPFFALFQGGAGLFRASGDSKLPMRISILTNLMNIVGNAVLIFVIPMGVAGAALSTLLSRVVGAVWILACLHRDRQKIVVRNYLAVRPDGDMIKKILFLSIPAGVENGMFQFGKLAIQSSVSTLGTTAIAAQAMTSILENVNGIAGCGVGIGMMTVVGQCLGAGYKDQAVYYIKKLTVWAEVVIISSCTIVYVIAGPVVRLAGMEPDAAALCLKMVLLITIVKPIFWAMSFIPAYGFRAAGDVKFTMLVSSLTMWLCRVAGSIFMIRVLHLGILSVWIGMFTDWGVRAIIYRIHFIRGKWLEKSVIG